MFTLLTHSPVKLVVKANCKHALRRQALTQTHHPVQKDCIIPVLFQYSRLQRFSSEPDRPFTLPSNEYKPKQVEWQACILDLYRPLFSMTTYYLYSTRYCVWYTVQIMTCYTFSLSHSYSLCVCLCVGTELLVWSKLCEENCECLHRWQRGNSTYRTQTTATTTTTATVTVTVTAVTTTFTSQHSPWLTTSCLFCVMWWCVLWHTWRASCRHGVWCHVP